MIEELQRRSDADRRHWPRVISSRTARNGLPAWSPVPRRVAAPPIQIGSISEWHVDCRVTKWAATVREAPRQTLPGTGRLRGDQELGWANKRISGGCSIRCHAQLLEGESGLFVGAGGGRKKGWDCCLSDDKEDIVCPPLQCERVAYLMVRAVAAETAAWPDQESDTGRIKTPGRKS